MYWLPSVLAFWPIFPLNQVLPLTTESPQILDLLGLVVVVFEFDVRFELGIRRCWFQ
jgi:hypothetical protein